MEQTIINNISNIIPQI